MAASLVDPSEFGTIFSRHYSRVYAYAARRIGVVEAGDVTSEVFLKAFKIRHRYKQKHPACSAWLLGIAHNTIGDRLRAIKRRDRVYLHLHGDTSPLAAEQADDRLVAESVSERLNEALAALSPNDREAFLLFAVDGLTYAEIAATLSIPSGTVGSRITRSRKRIDKAIPDLRQITDRIDDGQEEVPDA